MVVYINEQYDYPIVVRNVTRDLVRSAGHREINIDLEPNLSGRYDESLANLQQFVETNLTKIELYEADNRIKLLGEYNLTNGRIKSIQESFDEDYRVRFFVDYD